MPLLASENGCHGVEVGLIPALARAGRIGVEISRQNYRQVIILVGPQAGKATAANPNGLKPWKIIDVAGTRTMTRTQIAASW